jgi:hypothetical protein
MSIRHSDFVIPSSLEIRLPRRSEAKAGSFYRADTLTGRPLSEIVSDGRKDASVRVEVICLADSRGPGLRFVRQSLYTRVTRDGP